MADPNFKRKVSLPGGITVGKTVTALVGPTGPPGPTGPQGPVGPVGTSYHFVQSSPATPWIIVHGLNRYPSITVLLDAGSGEWEIADMPTLYVDLNTVNIIPPYPLAGRAELI